MSRRSLLKSSALAAAATAAYTVPAVRTASAGGGMSLHATTISGLSVTTGGAGTAIKITGDNFGNEPDDLCIILDGGGDGFLGLFGAAAKDGEVTAVVPGHYNAAFGNVAVDLKMIRGVGGRVGVTPGLAGVTLTRDPWVWGRDGEDPVAAPVQFTCDPPPAGTGWHSGGPTGGKLEVIVDQAWGTPPVHVCVQCRVHAMGTGADSRIEASLTLGGTLSDCTTRICDLIVKSMAAHPTRPLDVTCQTFIDGSNIRIEVTLTDMTPIDGGNLDIEIVGTPCPPSHN